MLKKTILAAVVAVAFGAAALTPTAADAHWHHHHGGWGWGGWGWGWGGWWAPRFYGGPYYGYYGGPYYGYGPYYGGRCFRKSSGRVYCYY